MAKPRVRESATSRAPRRACFPCPSERVTKQRAPHFTSFIMAQLIVSFQRKEVLVKMAQCAGLSCDLRLATYESSYQQAFLGQSWALGRLGRSIFHQCNTYSTLLITLDTVGLWDFNPFQLFFQRRRPQRCRDVAKEAAPGVPTASPTSRWTYP